MSSATFSMQDALCCCFSKSSAKKIDRDTVLPFILLPLLLLLASLSSITTVVMMVATGMAVLYVYSRPQKNNRSPFFFYWTVSSWAYLLTLYMIEVVGTLTVTVVENFIVLVLMACTLYFFYKMKHVADVELGMARGKEYSPMLTSDSKYCHICQIEVNERYFHSIWWNCCIFRPNYPYFVAGHLFAFVTLLFSTNIGLTTVCEIFTIYATFMVPNDCSMVYDDFDTALTFATCVYAAGYTLIVAFVLLRQLFVFIPKYSEPQWRRLRNVLNV